jgi:ATP-dependent RNA helicase DOB1
MLAAPVKRYLRRRFLEQHLGRVQVQVQKSGLQLAGEYRAMARVLRRLGYLSAEGVVTGKGRVAAHITSVDELLCTEVVLGGVLEGLNPAQICALLSCLLHRVSIRREGSVE